MKNKKIDYNDLNNSWSELIESDDINILKNDKIEVINKNFQVQMIDEKLDQLDIKAMDSLPVYESDLEIEIKKALEVEISKIPETIKDDIYKLEEKIDKNYTKLNENINNLNSLKKYAKNYNQIILDQLEYDNLEDLPENIVDNYNKNESMLLATGAIEFKNGSLEYKDIVDLKNYDYDNNFKSSLNDIDIIIDSSRKLIEDGLEINNYQYIEEEIYNNLFEAAAYGLEDSNDLTLNIKSKELSEFINDRDSYIKENIPGLNFKLSELANEIELSIEEASIDLDNDSLNIDIDMDKEKEKDYGFDF